MDLEKLMLKQPSLNSPRLPNTSMEENATRKVFFIFEFESDFWISPYSSPEHNNKAQMSRCNVKHLSCLTKCVRLAVKQVMLDNTD